MSKVSNVDFGKVGIMDKLEDVCVKSILNRGNRISEDTVMWEGVYVRVWVCVHVYVCELLE